MGSLARFALAGLMVTGYAMPAHAWLSGLESETYDVGRVPGVTVDGDLSDWGDDAFRIGPLVSIEGVALSPADFDVQVRIGWDDGAILVGLEVRDDVATESADRIRENDSVLIRLSDGSDSDRYLIVAIAPGAETGRSTIVEVDPRGTVTGEVVAAGQQVADGYALEVRLPLKPFGDEAADREWALQILSTDRDGASPAHTSAWFPWSDVSVGGMSHSVRLTDNPSAPLQAAAYGRYPDLLTTQVRVIADSSLNKQPIDFYDGEVHLADGMLSARDGRAHAQLVADVPDLGSPYRDPHVRIDDVRIPVTIRNADALRALHFTWHRVLFSDYAFSGGRFPEAKLEDPLLARHLIGPYTVATDYYDRNYTRVDRPAEDGRYGAVVTISADGTGRVYKRFRTLYKYSGRIDWWDQDVSGRMDLPDEMGIDPVVVEDQQDLFSNHLKWQFKAGLNRDQRAGALLAGLSESVPGDGAQGVYDNVWARDRAWWVGLKRKLYALPPVVSLQAPTGVFKGRAQELVFGSEEEAGFAAGLSEALDAVGQAWWEASGEPFSVCVARNGRVAHLRSYGDRNGAPVTLTTQVPIASITKLLTGTLIAMAVEHNRIDLDAPIDTYLPAFKGLAAGQRLTVRRLMNHTNGLESHWGDEQNDFEELIAGYAPEMVIGKSYQYNGTAFALAGKVLEAVSGESIPAFIKAHLLDPLECEDTDVFGTSWDGQSTPLDLARIGQMLLNGGAYGDFRFFEYEAFQAFLPRPLETDIPGTYRQYGLGTRYYTDEGLGEGTFGHGAESSTIFRVDPENQIVLVVTRWRHGEGYEEHKQKLLDTVIRHIQRETQTEADKG